MRVRDAELGGFSDAERFLGSRNVRRICENTWVERRGSDSIAVRFHRTDIVTYYRGGNVRVSSGGWRTSTTKGRINKFLSVPTGVHLSLYQENWAWFIGRRVKSFTTPDDWRYQTTHTFPFFDGIVIGGDGLLRTDL